MELLGQLGWLLLINCHHKSIGNEFLYVFAIDVSDNDSHLSVRPFVLPMPKVSIIHQRRCCLCVTPPPTVDFDITSSKYFCGETSNLLNVVSISLDFSTKWCEDSNRFCQQRCEEPNRLCHQIVWRTEWWVSGNGPFSDSLILMISTFRFSDRNAGDVIRIQFLM